MFISLLRLGSYHVTVSIADIIAYSDAFWYMVYFISDCVYLSNKLKHLQKMINSFVKTSTIINIIYYGFSTKILSDLPTFFYIIRNSNSILTLPSFIYSLGKFNASYSQICGCRESIQPPNVLWWFRYCRWCYVYSTSIHHYSWKAGYSLLRLHCSLLFLRYVRCLERL